MAACPVIDAHAHLWERIDGLIDGTRIRHIGGGRTTFPGGIRQMMPALMHDGKNTAERFLAAMDAAGVAGAVITQEYIDGIQNDYLRSVRRKYPARLRVCGMAEFRRPGYLSTVGRLIKAGFDGIKIPAQRLASLSPRVLLTSDEMMRALKLMEKNDIFLSIDLADGDTQVPEMEEIIREFPKLRIAIGHFGMVTRDGWLSQIRLARHENVVVESGGITWLFHKEAYPFRGAVRAIREAADLVGIGKIMWGSDYPRTMTAITYRMSFDFILKSGFNELESCSFLGGNASRFYRFAPPETPAVKSILED
ncbi:MAG: amidohydrolase family protein [Spirochaetota bacterium]